MTSMRAITAILIVALIVSTTPSTRVLAAPVATNPSPNGRVFRISPEEFKQIEPLLRQREEAGTIVVAQLTNTNASTNAAGTNVIHTSATNNAALKTLAPPPSATLDSSPTPDVGRSCDGLDGLLDALGRSDWSSAGDSCGDGGIVIFVVVGVTVVLAVVVYAAAFLYEAVVGTGRHTYWWDLDAQGSYVFGRSSSGAMAGCKLSSGIANSDARVGLVLEGGYLDATVRTDSQSAPVSITSAYGLAGAAIRWGDYGLNDAPASFGVELLAGTASAQNVDMISVARAQASLGITQHLRLGFSLGAMYMGLNTTDGLLNNVNNFSTLAGVQLGFRF